jgi:hypothetical protein
VGVDELERIGGDERGAAGEQLEQDGAERVVVGAIVGDAVGAAGQLRREVGQDLGAELAPGGRRIVDPRRVAGVDRDPAGVERAVEGEPRVGGADRAREPEGDPEELDQGQAGARQVGERARRRGADHDEGGSVGADHVRLGWFGQAREILSARRYAAARAACGTNSSIAVPAPGALRIRIRPPRCSTAARTADMPTRGRRPW